MPSANSKARYKPLNYPKKQPFVTRLWTPGTFGALSATAFAVSPSLGLSFFKEDSGPFATLAKVVPSSLDGLPRWLTGALLGFLLGLCVFKSIDWLRWRLLKQLLTYKGWVFRPKAATTKVRDINMNG